VCLVCRANNPTHDQQIIQLLSVNRALLSVNRALLSVNRALLSVNRALLSVNRALLSVNRALLSVYRALLSVYLYVVRWIVCLSCALFVLGHVSCLVFVMVM